MRSALSALVLSVPLAAVAQTSTLPSGEHTFAANGLHLWYKVAGVAHRAQAPLIYLHGGPGYNSYSFEHTIGAQLEQKLKIVYTDERGSAAPSVLPTATTLSRPW